VDDHRNQDKIVGFVPAAADLEVHLSRARLARYMREAGGNLEYALELYRWNAALCQSMYWPTQTAEIVTRNGICRTLEKRYGVDWSRNPKFRASCKTKDIENLDKTVSRQKIERRTAMPSTDQIVADLSFGFWVSLLTTHYAVPLKWPAFVSLSFPGAAKGTRLDAARTLAEDVRLLRNRMAHHEPIFHLDLTRYHRSVTLLTKWASPAAHEFVSQSCRFATIFADRPKPRQISN
jgi:hypothetical protein